MRFAVPASDERSAAGAAGGLTRTTMNRIDGKVARQAQLSEGEHERITPHASRYTMAMRVVRQRDLAIAADLLGHSGLSTTRHYVKASVAELEAAVETVYDVNKADTQ